MKLLIVDNEKHVIEAIQLLIDWHRFPFDQILVAYDGAEGIEKMKEHQPEVVLTDMMMPHVHGMEFVTWLSNNANYAKVIVISGYTDFEYIQHTIRYGGLDYITKPIDENQLNGAIEKAWEKLLKEKETLSQMRELKHVQQGYWEKLMLNILKAPERYQPDVEAFAQEFYIREGALIQMLAIRPMRLTKHLYEQFGQDMTLFHFAIKNVCEELLSEAAMLAFVFVEGSQKAGVKILIWDTVENTNKVAEKILSVLMKLFDMKYHIGISGVYKYSKGLEDVNSESVDAIAFRNVFDRATYLHNYIFKKERGLTLFYPVRDKILLALRGLNQSYIQEIIEALFESLKQSKMMTERQIEEVIEEYIQHRSYWIQTLACDESLVGQFPLMTEEVIALTVDERWLLKMRMAFEEDLLLLIRSAQLNIQEKGHSMQAIKAYIDLNYALDLSLGTLAEQFYISKEHLSRSFRKYFNINLSDYIVHKRIEASKILLNNPDMTVKEIAGLCGYEDEKYFAKVFRQKNGVSPNEYRLKNSY